MLVLELLNAASSWSETKVSRSCLFSIDKTYAVNAERASFSATDPFCHSHADRGL
jgi:hypothetical protein